MTPGGSSGPGARGPGARAGRRPHFAVILSITVTGIMAHVLITPALPEIAEEMDVPAARLGLLVAAATAPGIVLAPVMGVLADRFGRREVVVPCLVTFGLAGGAGSLAGSFAVLVGLRLAQGVAAAGLVNLAVVVITDHWHGVERGRRIGHNMAALTTAVVVLPPLGGALTSLGGWRATFLPYWLAPAAALAAAVGLPPSGRAEGSLGQQLVAARRALRSRAVLGPMLLGLVVFMLIFGLFLTAVPVYLSDRFGLGGAGRGLVMSLPAVTATVGALSLGRLKTRSGVRTVVTSGLVLYAVGFALVALVPSLVAVCAGALLYGLGDGLSIAALQDAVAGEAPEDSRGAVVATWMSFARAGQTAGPVLAGTGLDTIGARATFAMGAAVAALASCAPRFLVQSREPSGILAPGPRR